MDKIVGTIRGKVATVKTSTRQYKGADKIDLRVTIVPEKSIWPVTLVGDPTLDLELDGWYAFTVMIRTVAYADKVTGAPSSFLDTWILAVEPLPVAVAA